MHSEFNQELQRVFGQALDYLAQYLYHAKSKPNNISIEYWKSSIFYTLHYLLPELFQIKQNFQPEFSDYMDRAIPRHQKILELFF